MRATLLNHEYQEVEAIILNQRENADLQPHFHLIPVLIHQIHHRLFHGGLGLGLKQVVAPLIRVFAKDEGIMCKIATLEHLVRCHSHIDITCPCYVSAVSILFYELFLTTTLFYTLDQSRPNAPTASEHSSTTTQSRSIF